MPRVNTSNSAAYQRDRRREKADAGFCSKCCARKPKRGYFQCVVCIERGKAGMRLWRKKQRLRKLVGG